MTTTATVHRTWSRAIVWQIAALVLLAATAFGAFAGTARAQTPERGCALDAAANPDQAVRQIHVTVEKVRNSKGLITAVLYSDKPETFLKRGARLDRIRVDARQGETLLCLTAPSTGHFSVALYHDENGNKEFDRDFLGIPTEGYGFSQNPGFRFGKPDVEETLFTIEDSPAKLRISMLYLQD